MRAIVFWQLNLLPLDWLDWRRNRNRSHGRWRLFSNNRLNFRHVRTVGGGGCKTDQTRAQQPDQRPSSSHWMARVYRVWSALLMISLPLAQHLVNFEPQVINTWEFYYNCNFNWNYIFKFHPCQMYHGMRFERISYLFLLSPDGMGHPHWIIWHTEFQLVSLLGINWSSPTHLLL